MDRTEEHDAASHRLIPATFSKGSRRTQRHVQESEPESRSPSVHFLTLPSTTCRWGSAASRFLLYMIRRKQNEKQPETQTALLMQVKTHGGEKAKEKLDGPKDEDQTRS